MKRSSFLFFLASALGATGLCAQSANTAPAASGTATQPPPFTAPSAPAKTNEGKGPKIDPIARGIVEVAHGRWSKGVGLGLNPSLSFVGGQPTLTLVVDANETPAAKRHFEEAVVEACQFLVNDTAFESAVVCVTRVNSKNPKATKTENIVIHRAAFEAAIKGAGKNQKLSAAKAKLRGNDAGIHHACLELGFK